MSDVLLPTAFLPRLTTREIKISSKSLLLILHKLNSLYSIKSIHSNNSHNNHTRHAQDSGYSSEVEIDLKEESEGGGVGDLGKDDTYERSVTKEWLLKLIKRGEEWIDEIPEEEEEGEVEIVPNTASSDGERNRRIIVIDQASSLVASLSETSESGSISRFLSLPTLNSLSPLLITLHDALPSDTDPSSVGVQSWSASIILARMMALDPERFGMNQVTKGGRMLELGAGTGLLSLVWRGMLESFDELSPSTSETAPSTNLTSTSSLVTNLIVATDYHPTVLSNLSHNISLNEHPTSLPIQALKLDWSAIHSSLNFATTSTKSELVLPTPFDSKFDTLLAADVIYGPEHAKWLKSCAICFLKKPTNSSNSNELSTSLEALSLSSPITATPPPASTSSPTFHLIVPLRPTHTLAIASITEVFPLSSSLPSRENESSRWRMAIKNIEEIERVKGVGRADEDSYRLYNIGWC